MTKLLKFSTVFLIAPLVIACSNGPSDAEVESLIEGQYEQVDSMMNHRIEGIGGMANSDIASAMRSMMSGMMPELEGVDNINCDETDGKNTYLCTADVTEKVQGESRTDKANFTVYKVNDEWVLRR